jgi:hypothetical protein
MVAALLDQRGAGGGRPGERLDRHENKIVGESGGIGDSRDTDRNRTDPEGE